MFIVQLTINFFI